MNKTVVAMFTYNRPEKFQALLASFHACSRISEVDLVIFCDGQKEGVYDSRITENQEIVQNSGYIIPPTIIVRKTNIGLAQSIIRGVSELLSKYEQIIVFEDDLVLHPSCVDFMLSALERYRDEKSVFQISGYNYPISLTTPESAFFFPVTSSWGWATWSDRWKYFKQISADDISLSIKGRHKFDLYGAYPYYRMLLDAVNGKLETWDIQWYYAVFLQKGLVLYPTHSLINNTGFDKSGVHCGTTSHFSHTTLNKRKNHEMFLFPTKISCNNEAFSIICDYLAEILPLISLISYKCFKKISYQMF